MPRGQRNSLICNNCRRDKQKCMRDPETDPDGSKVCARCERYNYTNCSVDPTVLPMERKTRILNTLKCEKCRRDHKTCTFTYGAWPNPCDRCSRTGSQCSAPTRPSRLRNSKGSIASDNSDCMSTIAPSEFTEYTDCTDFSEYTDCPEWDCSGFEHGEDGYYAWNNDGSPRWSAGYQRQYQVDFSDPFSPDSGSSDGSSVTGYPEGPASPFAYRR